jgi:hypothetical protein
MRAEFFGKNVHIARHVETSKNLLGLHGQSAECSVSTNTSIQLNFLIRYIQSHGIKRVIFGKTKQCEFTSNCLASSLDVEQHALEITPFSMGEYSGLAHKQLREKNLNLSIAMEQFRYRALPYNQTALISLDDPDAMSEEILSWSENIPESFLNDSIYILSSSLINKVLNFSKGILPNSNLYLNIGFETAGAINIHSWCNSAKQWPYIEHKTLKTKLGSVVLAEHEPTLSMFKSSTVVIYPGVFGSSRYGPYNLFNRLAKKLAYMGIRCVLFDPIGSGESSDIYRSLETDIESVNAVINHYSDSKYLTICAHSISANIISNHYSDTTFKKHFISPLLNISKLKCLWKVTDEPFSRHGLSFSENLLNGLEIRENDDTTYYFGTIDEYVDLAYINHFARNAQINIFEKAGHNFSEDDTSIDLITSISEHIKAESIRNSSHTAT